MRRIADFRNFVKLGYMSKWLHHSGGTVCEPTDVPVNKRHLDMLLAHMTLSRQALHGLGHRTQPRGRIRSTMCEILFGTDFVAQQHRDDQPDQHQLPLTFDAP